jgi:hypothetical protein
MTPFERLKPSIFATESGGDYNALYNYANRAGNPFAGFNLTGMTVDEALEFASPSGPYAQYVKGQVGRVATPMGAYQVVGSTLAEAKKGLGLTGNEMMTEDLQDKIGQWIYKTQGPSAWEGLKGKDMATPFDRAREEELRMQMLATGMAPRTAPRAPLSALRQDLPQAAAAPQQRRGGLGGIMDYLGTPSPTTGLSRAEQFAAALDPLILPELRAGEAIRARGAQRQATATKNKTVEYLRRMGYNDYADAVESGSIGAKDIMNALVSKSLETPKDARTAGMKEYAEAVKDGFKGTFLDYKTAISKAGATSISMGKGPDEFARLDAKTLSEVAQTGAAAKRNIARINRLESLLANVPTGMTANLKQLAGNFGVATEGLSDIQAAQGLINSLVPEQRPAGSGPMSDADLELFKQALPRIVNQPNGNQIIINTMRGIAQYDAMGADIVQRYRSGEITSAEAFAQLNSRPDPFENLQMPSADVGDIEMTEEEARRILEEGI